LKWVSEDLNRFDLALIHVRLSGIRFILSQMGISPSWDETIIVFVDLNHGH